MPTTAITWQNLTNAVLDGSGNLEKNAGADNCFTNASGTGDGGARSVASITSGDFEFGCTLGPSPSGRSFVGLASSFSVDFTTWQYCIHVSTELNTSGTPHPVDSIFIYEGSPPNKVYWDGIWDEGKLLRIVCVNGVVRYYLDSLLLYTSLAAPSYPLYAVASLACLSRTVVNPYFITGSSGAPCNRGTDSGEVCSDPWTIPTPAVLPLAAAGGPQQSYFQEIEPDWGNFQQMFGDGKQVANTIQTARVRRWLVRWEGLSVTDAATLDAHWESTSGGLSFSMTDPHTSESITHVRYEDYQRPDHEKQWAQTRIAKLVKYTN